MSPLMASEQNAIHLLWYVPPYQAKLIDMVAASGTFSTELILTLIIHKGVLDEM